MAPPYAQETIVYRKYVNDDLCNIRARIHSQLNESGRLPMDYDEMLDAVCGVQLYLNWDLCDHIDLGLTRDISRLTTITPS